jgi:polysaccharide pyruvyl transferase WcaK-like protein
MLKAGAKNMIRATPNLERRRGILLRNATADARSEAATSRRLAWASRRRPAIPPQRIGLFGLFGSGNTGNDGSLEAMLVFLRQARPDAEIVCICAAQRGAAVRIAQALNVAAIPFGIPPPDNRLLRTIDRLLLSLPRRIPSLVRAIWQTRRLDALVIPGTGILDDFWEGPLNMPLTLFVWCLAARLCGTRIAFVSIGAGPIDHAISRWLMRSAIAMAQYRSYRDTISKDFMESIGFNTLTDAVYPDLAFKLRAPAPARRLTGQARSRTVPLTVGVGVMTYRGWRKDPTRGPTVYEAYLDKLTTFVLSLLDRGHPLRILMGDDTDRRAVADLSARVVRGRPDLPQDRLRAEPTSSLQDLMRQIAETDIVIATRFHNVVCALKLGRPTVSIGYAQKNDALMAEMGLSNFCQHIDNLDVELLIEQFTQLITDRNFYERRIKEMNFIYQERLDCQDSILASRFLGIAQSPKAGKRERYQ